MNFHFLDSAPIFSFLFSSFSLFFLFFFFFFFGKSGDKSGREDEKSGGEGKSLELEKKREEKKNPKTKEWLSLRRRRVEQREKLSMGTETKRLISWVLLVVAHVINRVPY